MLSKRTIQPAKRFVQVAEPNVELCHAHWPNMVARGCCEGFVAQLQGILPAARAHVQPCQYAKALSRGRALVFGLVPLQLRNGLSNHPFAA